MNILYNSNPVESLYAISLEVSDEDDPITVIEMYINNERITVNDSISDEVMFDIPLEKIILGTNNILFKATTEAYNVSYAKVILVKSASALNISAGNRLLIKNKVYEVDAVEEIDETYSITLDRGLESNIVDGTIVKKMINNINVYIQTNDSGVYSQMEHVETKFNTDNYVESYHYDEQGIEKASIKIDIVEGNEATAISKPIATFIEE